MRKLTTLCLTFLIGLATMMAATPERVARVPKVRMSNSGLRAVSMPTRQNHAKSVLPTIGTEAQTAFAARMANGPMKAGPTGSTVYGWLGYSTKSTSPTGFCEIFADGTYAGPQYDNDYAVTAAYIRKGKVNVFARMEFLGMTLFNGIMEYDMQGKLLNTINLTTSDHTQDVLTVAYDPAADKLYGYTLNANGDAYMFFSAPGSNPASFTAIPTTETCTAMTWDAVHGKLIGINLGNKLMEIDPATGATKTLAYAPVESEFISGLCYSPIDGCYLWNANTTYDGSDKSYFYKISYPDYTFTKVYEYQYTEQFISFMCTDTRDIDPKAPAAPLIDNVVLGTEEPQALIYYTIPTTTFDGATVTERFDYVCEVDGKEYTSGTVAPGNGGNPFMINYVDISEGKHIFTLKLSLKGKMGPEASRELYVGYDTPLTPQNVQLTPEGISWEAVTQGVNNGVIDLDNLTYRVSVDGKEVARDVKGTKYDYTLPEGELALHRASVVAVNHDHVSEAGLSNGMVAGKPLSLPQTIVPTEDQFQLCSTIDANNDGRSFMYNHDNNGDETFCYIYAAGTPADDYAVLPCMNFDNASAIYRVSLDAACSDDMAPEAFEVYVGTAPTKEAMTQCVIERTVVPHTSYARYDALFRVPAAGNYYVAVRAVSDPDRYYLFVRNVTVEKTDIAPGAPAAATEIQATPMAQGQLKATVEFKMPATTIDGNTIAASENLKATVSTTAGSADVTGTPGKKVSVEVPTVQGDNIVNITVSSSKGPGATARASVFTGVDRPDVVTNLRMDASEDNMTLHMTWEPPTTGVNGGYCAPTGLSYYLCTYENGSWNIGDKIGIDILSFDIRLQANAKQTLYRYGILAENEAGRGDYLSTAVCVGGKPYDMPFAESFADQSYKYGPIVIMKPDETYTGQWNIVDPSALGPQFAYPGLEHALACYNEADGPGKALVGVSKVSTEGSTSASFQLTFYYGLGADIEVLAATYGDEEPQSIGKISDLNQANLSMGYNDVNFVLPEKFQNRKWVQFYLRAIMENDEQVAIIPQYKVIEQKAHDLAVTIEGPSCIYIDREATATAVITNAGTQSADMRSGKWTIATKEGRQIAVEAVPAANTTLAPGESTKISYKFTPDAEYGQYARISYAFDTEDDKADNDKAEYVLWLEVSKEPVIVDLHATDSGDDFIDLAWTEPKIGFAMESFENETPDVQLPATIGKFKNIDGDDMYTYGMEGIPGSFPKGAFTVWSAQKVNSILGQTAIYAGHGDKFLIAFSPAESSTGNGVDDADDWLISPAVEGGSQISFAVAAISAEFVETIEVLYSTTDDDTNSFKLLDTYDISDPYWKVLAATLPEDARYFAIRYVSNDKYAVLIDMINYVPEGETVSVLGYEIIRDGNVIAPNSNSKGRYRDATITDRDAIYAYNIVPLLSDGTRGKISNTAYLQASGVNEVTGQTTLLYTTAGTIHAVGFKGCRLAVYTTDGKMIASLHATEHDTIEVPAGIYMVKAGNETYKVIVR